MSEELPEALSEREIEILRLVAQGYSNKEIARQLVISANTVKVHLRNIFAKLGASSRTEASMVAVRQGWVAVPAEAAAEPATAAAATRWPPPVARLARWQQVFLLAALAAVAVALALTWPPSAPAERAAQNPLSDNPQPAAVTAPPSLPSRWQEELPLLVPRARLAVVAVNGRIYAIGGEVAGGGLSGAVEVYDPAQQVWTARTAKPMPVANVAGAVLGGKVYVPGGSTFSEAVMDIVEVYDPVADRWTQAARLPAPRAAYALAVHAEKLYLIGGTDGRQQSVATVLVYDPAADEWQSGPAMPAARSFASAATLGEAIYVVGGYADGRELDTCQLYRPLAEAWDTCTPLREGRGGLSLVAVGHSLYAIGGGWASYLAYNQWYDPERDIWFRFETPVSGQWRNAAAAEVDGQVYVVGGWSDEFLNVNLAYQATYKAFLPSVPR